jgi:hypothetical protein
MRTIEYHPAKNTKVRRRQFPLKDKSPSGPECPNCHARNSKVVDSRPSPDGTQRRRRVCVCNHDFTTYEVVAVIPGLSYEI